MTQGTERLGYGQFIPADEGCTYFLYDNPEEWGLRVGIDRSVTIGPTATVEGEYPDYRVSLPSGMQGQISGSSLIVFGGASNYMSEVSLNLAAELQRAL